MSQSTGDSYDSSGILRFQSSIEKIHPGIFIHSVYIDPDSKEDQRATYVRFEGRRVPPSLHLLPLSFPNPMLRTVWKRRRPGGVCFPATERRASTVWGLRRHWILPRFVRKEMERHLPSTTVC